MQHKRRITLAACILGIALAVVLGRHWWVWRHYYGVRSDIDAAIVEARPIIDAIERARTPAGHYPQALPRLDEAVAAAAGARGWRYVPATYGSDYELFCTHSHWVSSFNALVYSPDGEYGRDWTSLRHRTRGGWIYVIGASRLHGRWEVH